LDIAPDLSGANLAGVSLVGTNLAKAKLTNCRIYGISAWNARLDGAEQQGLVIVLKDE
jgi:uncharacterized protein YjbI with pentapeptide repeats